MYCGTESVFATERAALRFYVLNNLRHSRVLWGRDTLWSMQLWEEQTVRGAIVGRAAVGGAVMGAQLGGEPLS